MAVTVNEGTETDILTTQVGGTETQIIRVDVGSGTAASAFTGSITNVAQVHNAGTIASIPQVSVGTIPSVTVDTFSADIPGGTIDSGTIVGPAADGAAVSGNPVRVAGKDSGGTTQDIATDTDGHVQNDVLSLPDLPGGTLDAGTVVISSFTPDPLGSVHVTNSPTITGFNTGTVSTGSLTNLATLHDGTVTVSANNADIPGGTIDAGTVQSIGMRHEDEFATVVSTGTSVLGTIKPAVSGSQIFVTGLVVSVNAASNVVVGDGGTANPILGTLFFAGSGGAVNMPFDPPIRTTAGSALVFKQSANTGMSITCVGYVD